MGGWVQPPPVVLSFRGAGEPSYHICMILSWSAGGEMEENRTQLTCLTALFGPGMKTRSTNSGA